MSVLVKITLENIPVLLFCDQLESLQKIEYHQTYELDPREPLIPKHHPQPQLTPHQV